MEWNGVGGGRNLDNRRRLCLGRAQWHGALRRPLVHPTPSSLACSGRTLGLCRRPVGPAAGRPSGPGCSRCGGDPPSIQNPAHPGAQRYARSHTLSRRPVGATEKRSIGGSSTLASRMLAKLPALPFLTATETAALGFFPSCDLLTSPSVNFSKKKYGRRINIQPNIEFGKTQDANKIHRKWRTLSADPAQAVVVDAGESKTWEECKQILTSLIFSIEDTEKMLKKAFGWIHTPDWSEERTKEVPNVEVVSGVLDYIRGLGLSDDDLYKLLKKFPEVLGCDLDS